ncbi:unnamed protein product [Rhodiola kirilowii]
MLLSYHAKQAITTGTSRLKRAHCNTGRQKKPTLNPQLKIQHA